MVDNDEELIEEALKVYEIPPQWVLASHVRREEDVAVIVTHGGKKVLHKRGEAAKYKLKHEEISGFLPKKEMFFADRLNGRIAKEELYKK